MKLGEYLGDKLAELLLHAILLAITSAFLRLTGTASGVVLIVIVMWMLALTAYYVVGFLGCRHRMEELEAIMAELDKQYLFYECVPKPRGAYEKRLFNLMGKSSKSMIEAVSNAEATQREYREYIESWVHEIKAPITTASLISQSLDGDLRRRLMPQLAQIESHVERALFYARAESVEKDFIIGQSNLSGVVAQAVEGHRVLLIQSGVRVETRDLDMVVYTDHKWLIFILGQLIQNAVRYKSEHPVITIAARRLGDQVVLELSDNGIGIPAHELSRVFERGFTGGNGRSRGGATGMGLYICGKLAKFLELGISAKSTENQGTMMTILLSGKAKLTKL